MNKQLISHSYEETMEIGIKLANLLNPGTVIRLTGDLGAGKTTFVRGLAQGLGIEGTVQSPTFNIMKIYSKVKKPLIHIDAYRLADINSDIGLDEYIGYSNGITVIEWPDFINDLIPSTAIEMRFTYIDENTRNITIITNDENLLRSL